MSDEYRLVFHRFLVGSPNVRFAMRYEVASFPSYQQAYDEWARLDRAFREERLFTTDLERGGQDRLTWVQRIEQESGTYLAVRNVGDPRWQGLPIIKLYAATTAKGTIDEDAVVRRWGNAHGYEGRSGGWIYQRDSNRGITQGWGAFRTLKLRRESILTWVDTTAPSGRRLRYFLNETA